MTGVTAVFPSFIPLSEFAGFFEKWGLPWKQGDYHITSFAHKPSTHQLFRHSTLPMSYSMKAVHLVETKAEYTPTEDSLCTDPG